MRRFVMNRIEDETGISGTGRVLEGVEFGDGSVAIRWTTAHRSWCIYTSITEVIALHGHGGLTELRWLDADPETPKVVQP